MVSQASFGGLFCYSIPCIIMKQNDSQRRAKFNIPTENSSRRNWSLQQLFGKTLGHVYKARREKTWFFRYFCPKIHMPPLPKSLRNWWLFSFPKLWMSRDFLGQVGRVGIVAVAWKLSPFDVTKTHKWWSMIASKIFNVSQRVTIDELRVEQVHKEQKLFRFLIDWKCALRF